MPTTARVTRHGMTSGRASRSSVAEEMAAIFAPLPQPASPAAIAGTLPAVGIRNRSRHWRIAAVVVALATLIAALLAVLATPRRSTPHPAVSHRPAAAHIATPSPSTVAPALPPAAQTARSPAATAPAPSGADTGAAHPAAKAADISPPPRISRLSIHRTAKSRTNAGARRCPRGATSAWCLRGAVMAADDRLRGAYAAAIRTGVDRSVLIGVRSDWKRLRGRANKDPQALIRGYALLTQELRAEAGRAGGR